MKCALCEIIDVFKEGFVCGACRLWMEGKSPSEEKYSKEDEEKIHAEIMQTAK